MIEQIIINCTPHEVMLNSGERFPRSSFLARVSARFIEVEPGRFVQEFGQVEGLPSPSEGTLFIVSAMVFSASTREDLIAPATGHPDVVRDERGQIVSVPGFIVK